MNRRDFFKIVTVSSAAAATGGCQQASETILPLVVPNEQLVPGVASWFATVCRECPAIAVVTQLENGSLGGLLDRWVQALGARPRVTLEPFAYESIRAANRLTFNRDAIPYYAFEDAEVVFSFGADFIETWLSNVNYARTFARMHSFRDG